MLFTQNEETRDEGRKNKKSTRERESLQHWLVTLTCGDTAGNVDATDPLGTRRHHRDADYSKRKEENSSWTWGRYFLQWKRRHTVFRRSVCAHVRGIFQRLADNARLRKKKFFFFFFISFYSSRKNYPSLNSRWREYLWRVIAKRVKKKNVQNEI